MTADKGHPVMDAPNPRNTAPAPVSRHDQSPPQRLPTPVQWLMALAVYLVLAVATMGANPLTGETVAPMDLLVSHPGWDKVAEGVRVTHAERSDVLDALLPTWLGAKDQLRNGEPALWLPGISGGKPGLPLISNGMLTPSFLAFALIGDHALGFYAAGLIKLVLAGLGVFLLLRLFLGPAASLFGGAVFMLAGFNAAWFFWPQVSTAAWIPWLLWCGAGWMLTGRRGWLAGIALTTALLILGGFPSVAAYGLYAFVLLIPVLMAGMPWRPGIAAGVAAGAAVALGFLLSALPLLAQVEFLSLFDLGYRSAGTALSWTEHYRLFVDPRARGVPRVEFTFHVGWIALLLTLVPVALWTRWPQAERRLLFVFGTAILLASIVLAFGLAPHEWIRRIPVFGFNPWSRVTVITGLAVALLAALGLQVALEQARRIRRPLLATGLLAGLAALAVVQIVDQSRLFRTFNAVVPAAWFYPDTPTLTYARERLGPLDWVIADNAFMISGTLTAYGLPEWFAHTFKTPAEKSALEQLVDAPFRTPTAATFPLESIRFEHPLMNAFGVRFALVEGQHHDHEVLFTQPAGAHQPAPPLPENRLDQHFRLDRETRLSGVSVLMATYRAPYAPSDLRLTLDDDRGDALATVTVSRYRIRDNRWARFFFPRTLELPPGGYSFSLALTNPEAGGRVTPWTTAEAVPDTRRLAVNGEARPLAMRFSLMTPAARDHGWTAHRLEPAVTLLENPRAPRGAYYLGDAHQPPADGDGTQVRTARIASTALTARYEGDAPGLIVFPMRHYPGWEARVDDRPAAMDTLLGVLPAVHVQGPGRVELHYRPTYTLPGLLATLAGLGGLLLLLWQAPAPHARAR